MTRLKHCMMNENPLNKLPIMKLNKIFACLLVASAAWQGGYAQETKRNITLEETINLARAQSVNAAVALNELKAAYWEYRTFRADLR